MFDTFLGLLGGIKNKLMLFGTAAMGVLYLLFKREKTKRKEAEEQAEIAEENAQVLDKHIEIVTDLDLHREKDFKKFAQKEEKQAKQLEGLKHEDDDSIVVDNLLSLLNKDKD